ncbi:MAG: hypothetical protein WA880_06645 [Ornithinimicrobium sp.]
MADSAFTRRRGLFGLFGLSLASVLALGGWWLWPRPSLEAEPTPAALPLVVLVSGYGGDGRDLVPIVAALEAQEREVAVFPPVGDNTGDLEEQAAMLGDFIDKERGEAETVDVIGYSAGGVVARLWVTDDGGDTVARRVLTIAAPHHGTALAGLADLAGFCDGSCAQLIPDSDLLARLNADDETPSGPEWISIWSDSDRTVTPPSTASLDGALNLTVQSICPDATTGHAGLPASPVVTAALVTALGADTPSAPVASDVTCDG